MLYEKRQELKFVKKLENLTAKLFAHLPFSPNFYTLLSLFFAFVTFGFLYFQKILPALITYLFAIFLDFVDGAVARAKKLSSKKGAYLDTITDRWVEIIILLGFLFLPLPDFFFSSYFWIFLLLAGSLMTTYTKAAAKEKEIVKTELKGGVLERGERTVGIFLALLLAEFEPFYSVVLISILAFFSVISALQRTLKALKKA